MEYGQFDFQFDLQFEKQEINGQAKRVTGARNTAFKGL